MTTLRTYISTWPLNNYVNYLFVSSMSVFFQNEKRKNIFIDFAFASVVNYAPSVNAARARYNKKNWKS